MPSRSSRRAPLEETSITNSPDSRSSISTAFKGTKPSIGAQKTKAAMTNSAKNPSRKTGSSRNAKRAVQDSDDSDDHSDAAPPSQDESDHDSFDEDVKKKSSPTKPKGSDDSLKNRQLAKAKHGANPNSSFSVPFQNSRVAALAKSHAVADSSLIMGGSRANPSSSAADAAPALRVDTNSFEEWMKMATDNKINSTNTWSFALIDYFHDMSLLRNESGDGSINFQKASCTLDGCVKVWTSRVDSVVVETGKLLSGLQDEVNQASGKEKRTRGEDGEELDEEGDDFDDDDATGTGNRRKKAKSKETSLAKNFSQIQVKKFDLEFTVDPLFKKTSADFDEGGAGGLLMNHLGVDKDVRVVFDASDVAGVGDDADINETLAGDVEGQVEQDTDKPKADSSLPENDLVDLTRLRQQLFGSEGVFDSDGKPFEVSSLLAGRVICPTLCNFRFSKDDDTPFGVGMDELEDQGLDAMHVDVAGMGSGLAGRPPANLGDFHEESNPMLDDDGGNVDFFAAAGSAARADVAIDEDDDDGMIGDNDDGLDFFDAPESGADLVEGAGAVDSNSLVGGAGGVEGYGRFDPSAVSSQRDIVMAMAFNGPNGDAEDDEGEGGLFDYFDRKLMRNWAGPEHWKLSRVATGAIGLGVASNKKDEVAARTASGVSVGKKSKEPFVIDFLSEEAAINSKEIFEPAKQPGSISLPAAARSKMSMASSSKDAYLLPEDRHFSSKQLLRLFIKPRVAINIRRKGQMSGNVDEQYWAEAAAAYAGGNDGMDEYENGAAIPFDTQFFHDNDDGFDPGLNGVGAGDDMGSPSNLDAGAADLEDEELMQTMVALNRVRPEYVNYAKKAKRVDVKKLKENIWKQLGIVSSEIDPEHAERMQNGASDESEVVEEQPTKTFDTVLDGLRKAYPKDKMEEISTSFCFICLLHLANEEGLKITTGNEEKLEEIQSRNQTQQKSTASDGMGNMLSDLAAGISAGARIVTSNQEDDQLGEEGEEYDVEQQEYADEDEIKVGKLESLRIVKDPMAYRSA